MKKDGNTTPTPVFSFSPEWIRPIESKLMIAGENTNRHRSEHWQ